MDSLALFLKARVRVLEHIVNGGEISDTLGILCRDTEEIDPVMRCSVLYLDQDTRCLRHAAAPSLPDFYNEVLDGLHIGPGVGSCGTAAYTGERVIVQDVYTHPYWEPFRDLAKKVGFHACWSQPIYSKNKEVLGTFAMYYDEVRRPTEEELQLIQAQANLASLVIERNRNEDALRESESKLSLHIQNTPLGAVSWDKNFHCTEWNKAAEKIFGYSADEVIGRHAFELILPDGSKDEISNLHRLLLEQKGGTRNTNENITKNGEIIICDWYNTPIIDRNGEVTGVASLVQDITERKRVDEALRKTEEQLDVAIESISDGFVLFDAEDRFVFSNSAYLKSHPMLGEILVPGIKFEKVARKLAAIGFFGNTPEEIKQCVEMRLEYYRTGRPFEYRMKDKRWFEIKEYATRNGGMALVRIDITERKQAEAQLLKAMKEAEEANKVKSEFLASMSHELRTPLNAVLGFAQMLQFDPKNPLSSAQNLHVEHILEGGNHLLELVNDVLDLARIEAGQLDLALEEVNANEVIADCITLTDSLGEPRGINIVNQSGDGLSVTLRTDRMRLKQILINLLFNAVKFNKDGGTVTVDSQKTDDSFLRISVSDTGIGIARKDFPNVFHMFHRLGADPMIAREGTGIGLTVTKLLVEGMAGAVGFESKEGVGSTFWVELPLASNDEVLVWADCFDVEVDAIDKDHRVLISLLNQITHGAVEDRNLDKAFGELIDYTRYHFRREEAIMEACDYPDLEKHRGLHKSLVSRVNDLAETWRKDRGPDTLLRLHEFLREWLFNHIIKVDTGISRYTRGKEADIHKALKDLG